MQEMSPEEVAALEQKYLELCDETNQTRLRVWKFLQQWEPKIQQAREQGNYVEAEEKLLQELRNLLKNGPSESVTA